MGKITVNQLLATPGIDADLSQYSVVKYVSKNCLYMLEMKAPQY